MSWIMDPQIWISLITLTALEIVLGIDNIVFITILADKLQANQRKQARQIGLALALITRILLLLSGILLTLGCISKPLATHHPEIIEVRVYEVAEGKMEEWERFFHEKLVEPQEEAGIKILTAYRTLGDENLFVWSRQFSSKANMAKERSAFYQSDLWKENLRPELNEKGFIEKVEIVYTVRPSKRARN